MDRIPSSVLSVTAANLGVIAQKKQDERFSCDELPFIKQIIGVGRVVWEICAADSGDLVATVCVPSHGVRS